MAVKAVATTGIYCRPGCPARPNPGNVSVFALPAAAEAAGYRACHRCRPYRSDEPLGVIGPELVCRTVQMVCDGALDDGSEAQLAAAVGVSPRHLRRLFVRHVGVTPDGLARSLRAHFARRLLDETDLTVADVAFAAGYGSVRQLQRACVDIFGEAPSDLRRRRSSGDHLVAETGLRMRLWHPGDFDWDARLADLAASSTEGVDAVQGRTYLCTLCPPEQPGTIELRPLDADHLELHAELHDWHSLMHVVRHARRLAGIDEVPAVA